MDRVNSIDRQWLKIYLSSISIVIFINIICYMWKEENNQLTATFKFTDFVEAFAFMTEVAFHAEKQNHHPNWNNVWNRVEISLSTHDAGNVITDKDRKLAVTIDQIYAKYNH